MDYSKDDILTKSRSKFYRDLYSQNTSKKNMTMSFYCDKQYKFHNNYLVKHMKSVLAI